MIRSSLFLAMVGLACAAEAQQAPAPAPVPAPNAGVGNVTPSLVQRTDPFVTAFRARNSLRNGINSTYLPPQAIFYVDSYQKAEQTSRCLVAEAGTSIPATNFWTSLPNSQPERRSLADWARRAQGCYMAGLRVPRSLIRGALAEAVLEQSDTVLGASAPTSQQLRRFYVAEAERRRASSGADQEMSAFASCVAPLATGQMPTLFATRHGSREERRAMNRVLANGSSCIVGDWHLPKAGGTSFLRAYLAEATYRWVAFSRA